MNSGGLPSADLAEGWQAAQLPLAGLLNSARPRVWAAESVAVPRKNASYWLENARNPVSSRWYCCKAKVMRSALSALAISMAPKKGWPAWSLSELARPSRKKPPVGVPSAAKLNAGLNDR